MPPAPTAPTAPATAPTRLGDSKGSASRSRAGASTRLLRLYVPERFLDGSKRGIPGVRQLANLGLPGSGRLARSLLTSPPSLMASEEASRLYW